LPAAGIALPSVAHKASSLAVIGLVIAARAHRHNVVDRRGSRVNLAIALPVSSLLKNLLAANLALVAISFIDISHRKRHILDAMMPSSIAMILSVLASMLAPCFPRRLNFTRIADSAS
jgi:hypothetical protein